MFTLGFFLWNVLGMHRCGPIEGVRSEENWDVDRGREWCLPGRKEEKEKVS